MRHLPLLALSLTALAGCGGYGTYVRSDDTSLGRVVVYRNGIAYFERRAQVDGDKLALRVPHDKVDDFLKSLTVADAQTGKAWPISFPTTAAAEDGMVEMMIQLPRGGHNDLVLSYITEAPSWKPSYRLVVKDGQIDVQGWAIVDNVSGEDWKDVRLGVGSSSALSFRYDLRTVKLVYRETLRTQETFAKAPPTGGSVHSEKPAEAVFAELADKDIPREEGHPDAPSAHRGDDLDTLALGGEQELRRETSGLRGATMGTGSGGGGHGGRYPSAKARMPSMKPAKEDYAPRPATVTAPTQAPPQPPADGQRVKQMAQVLNGKNTEIVIEGYADANERDPMAKALDRANLLRNKLIAEGVAPARLRVEGKGIVSGRSAGVRLVEDGRDKGGQDAAKAGPEEAGTPIGESHFESKTSMTVKKGTSAMVSILEQSAPGEIVYLYDAEAERGSDRFAFRAVRLRNPTESTLETGPVTVYGEGRFIGEGLSEPIPPHATAFVPFALDRQVVVGREGSDYDRIARLVTLQRGILNAEVQHTRKTRLTVTNRLQTAASVFLRHTVRKGWSLTKSPKLFEKLGDAHLFEIKLAAGASEVVEIEEATPLSKTIDLRSAVGIDLVRAYLEAPQDDKRFVEPMKKLLSLYAEMANYEHGIQTRHDQMDEYRQRLDELHVQVLSLTAVKAGASLLQHLRDKMAEISQRVQKATIEVVDLREKLMLAKVRFQDGLSELTLDTRVAETK